MEHAYAIVIALIFAAVMVVREFAYNKKPSQHWLNRWMNGNTQNAGSSAGYFDGDRGGDGAE
ncbi:MAG: hypothetical protein ABJL99_02950 [Aliishimia sp.]